MEKVDFLVKQYELVEDRRTYFGKLFWQLPGFFIAVFVAFIGVADKGESISLRTACLAGGIVFILISWIAYRLRVSQDECEKILETIEKSVSRAGLSGSVQLPRSKRYGARMAVIAALVVSGAVLLFISRFWSLL
jgi:hypothetical protein